MRYFLPLLALLFFIGCSSDGGDEPREEIEAFPPGQATLLRPENNKTCAEGEKISDRQSSLTFEWEASENTDSYDLRITHLETGTASTFENISATSYTTTLNHDYAYSWELISRSGNTTEIATSNTWKFYLAGDGQENYAPFPAEITYPAAGVEIDASTGKITLQWNGSDPDQDTLQYTVYIDTVDGHQTPTNDRTNIATTSIEVDVESDAVYYWKVKSTDTNSNASFTTVHSFRTQ